MNIKASTMKHFGPNDTQVEYLQFNQGTSVTSNCNYLFELNFISGFESQRGTPELLETGAEGKALIVVLRTDVETGLPDGTYTFSEEDIPFSVAQLEYFESPGNLFSESKEVTLEVSTTTRCRLFVLSGEMESGTSISLRYLGPLVNEFNYEVPELCLDENGFSYNGVDLNLTKGYWLRIGASRLAYFLTEEQLFYNMENQTFAGEGLSLQFELRENSEDLNGSNEYVFLENSNANRIKVVYVVKYFEGTNTVDLEEVSLVSGISKVRINKTCNTFFIEEEISEIEGCFQGELMEIEL